jgi:hypothetical protein
VVPPLIQAPDNLSAHNRDRILIMGYDRATLEMAFHVLKSIESDQQVDLFLPSKSKQLCDNLPFDSLPHQVRYLHSPTDSGLSESMSHAKLVLGESWIPTDS